MPRTTFALCALALLLALPAAVHSAAPAGDGAPDPNRTKPGPYRPLPLTVLAIDKESIKVRRLGREDDVDGGVVGVGRDVDVAADFQVGQGGGLDLHAADEVALLVGLLGRDDSGEDFGDLRVDAEGQFLGVRGPGKNGDKAKEKQRGEKK